MLVRAELVRGDVNLLVEGEGGPLPLRQGEGEGARADLQYSTVQYSTVQYSTVQYSTISMKMTLSPSTACWMETMCPSSSSFTGPGSGEYRRMALIFSPLAPFPSSLGWPSQYIDKFSRIYDWTIFKSLIENNILFHCSPELLHVSLCEYKTELIVNIGNIEAPNLDNKE